MKRIKKIKRTAISTTLPINTTILAALSLDYWKATDLIIGIVLTILGLLWIVSITNICLEEHVDPFKDQDDKITEGKSIWMEKLEEAMKRKKKNADNKN